MTGSNANLEAFHAQADICRLMQSPLTANIIDVVADLLDETSHVGRRILDWAGNPSGTGDALALRLAGGLHALARSGKMPELTAVYAGNKDTIRPVIAEAIASHDPWLAKWLDSPPQTNEAGRSAAIMAGLSVAAARYNLPFDLCELGSSAGLVLNMAHYRFTLGTQELGEPDATLHIAPEWRGPSPPKTDIHIVSARGVDRQPIRLDIPASAEHLTAYVWPDQTERLARLEQAIVIARTYPPIIDQGDAADWAEAQLAMPAPRGRMRVLFHTIAFQYFPEDVRNRVRKAVKQAGVRATIENPFAWLYLEANDAGNAIELRLHLWPGGGTMHLADAHPHCHWIEWKEKL